MNVNILADELLKGIVWYKDRKIPFGSKIKVYFNLHKRLFSIVSLEGEYKGKVIGHAYALTVNSPKFTVNKKCRQRVLAEKRKNVHAFVVGRLAGAYIKERAEKKLNMRLSK